MGTGTGMAKPKPGSLSSPTPPPKKLVSKATVVPKTSTSNLSPRRLQPLDEPAKQLGDCKAAASGFWLLGIYHGNEQEQQRRYMHKHESRSKGAMVTVAIVAWCVCGKCSLAMTRVHWAMGHSHSRLGARRLGILKMAHGTWHIAPGPCCLLLVFIYRSPAVIEVEVGVVCCVVCIYKATITPSRHKNNNTQNQNPQTTNHQRQRQY